MHKYFLKNYRTFPIKYVYVAAVRNRLYLLFVKYVNTKGNSGKSLVLPHNDIKQKLTTTETK